MAKKIQGIRQQRRQAPRNPPDATLRNINALKKRLTVLETAVDDIRHNLAAHLVEHMPKPDDGVHLGDDPDIPNPDREPFA